MKDFLFEIGVEEIPAGYIKNTISALIDTFKVELNNSKLEYKSIKSFTTPRRFAIKIMELQTCQKDEVVKLVGPPKSIAYDDEGNLTKAGSGFLKKAGASEDEIYFEQSSKGDKLAIQKEVKGKNTEVILADIILSFLQNTTFPKSMRWNSKKLLFARPIRWILTIFGKEIIPVQLNGIESTNISFGNRFQKLDNPVTITKIEKYEQILESVYVIPDRLKRRQLIQTQISQIRQNTEKEIIENDILLEIVTDLVEYPTAVLAEFDEKYLKLPEKVVTSTLSEHQKYFSVKDLNGNLAPNFIFISNGNPEFSQTIKTGNEKVITARLEDAAFFYKEDTKIKLEEFVPKLSEVTFQQQLGSVLEKTDRIGKIAEYVCRQLNFGQEFTKDVLRAAFLSKADLVTQMLGEKEFTKLQGYIGHQYALQSGEKKAVAKSIEEHYSNGENEISLIGSIVAIADKIDTICGIIGVEMLPTGSKDPFALRRAANGIVKIIDSKNFNIDLIDLIDAAIKILADKVENSNRDFIIDFFRQRSNWLLKQLQIDYDIIESVMHIDFSHIPDLVKRATALQNIKQQDNFIKLVLGFKRVSNIIENIDAEYEVDRKLFQEEMEKTLFQEYLIYDKTIKELLAEEDYEKILLELINFGRTIDKFFDEVLVNVENEDLKKNRFAVLKNIRQLFMQVADISKIVVEEKK